jgi:thioredoxin 1
MLPYADTTLSPADVQALPGVTVLNFGANWCGICQAAAPHIEEALAAQPGMLHMKVEDGPGRPLGRAFKVKLWPTLVVLQDGIEVARVVRPADAAAVAEALGHANRIADPGERPLQTIAP